MFKLIYLKWATNNFAIIMLHCGRYALQPYYWGQDLSASIWRPKLRLWQRWTGSQVCWEWGWLLSITTSIFTILLEPEICIELWFTSFARANLATDQEFFPINKIFIWMGIHLHESNTNIHFICHNLSFCPRYFHFPWMLFVIYRIYFVISTGAAV